MAPRAGEHRLNNIWWGLILFAAVAAFLFVTGGTFLGTFRNYLPVTLVSERSGLIMEPGAKVMMRGVLVGKVGDVGANPSGTSLQLQIDRDQVTYIPANVEAQIQVTSGFGAKYVDLIYPEQPSAKRLAAGDVLHSRNVTTEVNTVFESAVEVVNKIDPAKLNAVLSAVAEGVRGKGERIGQATTDLNEVLLELNKRSDIIGQDWRSLKKFSDTYAASAGDITTILDAAATTSTTVVGNSKALDTLLHTTSGFYTAGTNLLDATSENFIGFTNSIVGNADVLYKYSPMYTCFLQGADWYIEHGGRDALGGDGKSLIFDASLLFGNDSYVYPDNLPIHQAKGGEDGKIGCGSLPDLRKNFPARQVIYNVGFGTGGDIRANPGIGHPCYADYFPMTRASPELPRIRKCIPGPAVGLQRDYSDLTPAYGAPLYGPGGVPLWPVVPPPGEPWPAPGPATGPPPAPQTHLLGPEGPQPATPPGPPLP